MGNCKSILVLLLLFIFPLISCNSDFLCQPRQAHALLQFKSSFTTDIYASWMCDALGVASYPKTESWKEGTDCCSTWDGVTCDELTGHVIGLDLSCSQLKGAIQFHSNTTTLFSSHIAPYVHNLNLAVNNLHGSNISQLFVVFGSSLTHLNLTGTQFGGNVPSEISHLSNLVSIDLSGSGFSGNIPSEISLLSNLVHLDFSWCAFTGIVPPQISHLSDLAVLDLSYNHGLRVESGRVLDKISSNLTRLSVLHLDFVDMSWTLVSSSLMNLSSSLTSLSLGSCNLQGPFPASFLLFPNLQILRLYGNNFDPVTSLLDFNSTHPSKYLTFLDLSHINLSSTSITLLDFVGTLFSLRFLHLLNCSLSGSIPTSLCSMTHLQDLDLGHNCFNGPLPSCLFDMPPLESMRLNDNKLHGQIPTSLVNSVSLTTLHLSNNNLSSSISTATATSTNLTYSLPKFQDLNLASCGLTEFPVFLKALTNLTSLDVSNNRIRGPIPEWIFDVGRYTLSTAHLYGNLLTSVGQLQWEHTRLIDFHSNLLQGPIPIPPSTTIFFSVSNNTLSGDISPLICNLTSLQLLDLSHNHFVGSIPPCFGNLTRLSVLNLGNNNLHGLIPNTFTKDNTLNFLILKGNHLRGSLPRSLSYCQQLKVLDAGNNSIHDAFPYWLETLSTLQVLVLRSNKFFGSIHEFKSRVSFPALRILDVSDNNLAGRLPARLISNLNAMMNVLGRVRNGGRYMIPFNVSYGGNYYSMIITVKGLEMMYEKVLTTMTTIDFSENRFEGDIPQVIGKLGSLKGLNLSHNLLTGHIPSSMGDLVELEWLDLSSNHLVGKIPGELVDLTFLAVLNLSHNRLDGPIPQGRQFNTFGNNSYSKNLGLCGIPMSKACGTSEEAPYENDTESLDSTSGFSWESAYVGYGCGIAFGVYMGYLVFSSGSPQWLVRMVEGKHLHGRVVKRSKKSAHNKRRDRRRN